MRVQVYLTGTLRVESADGAAEEHHLAGRQARLAAAFLLIERHRPVARAELAEALWPDALPRSWETALRGVVAKVRAFLASAGMEGAEAIQTVHGAYRVQLPAGTIVDLEVATDALGRAERLLDQGDADRAVSAALAAQAVTAQPFLSGEHGLWAETKQTELRGRHQRALLVLARARLARGEAELAARDAQAAVAAEPLVETGHQLVIQAMTAAGNRGAALRAYEQCRRTLVDELGVGPSPETEWLYLALLRDEPPSPRTESVGTARVAPTSVGSFVGRTAELTVIAGAWARVRGGERQAVFVGGEAGIGKTRLVAEASQAASRDGAVVLHGRCEEAAAPAFEPFAEALARYLATCSEADVRRLVGGGGAELARLVVGLAGRLGDLATPPPTDPETGRHRLFQAMAGFLSALAAKAPVVLVLDDLQWAGAPTLLMLGHLVRALESSPVLMLGTYRDDEAGGTPSELADALVAFSRGPETQRLVLTGLAQSDVEALVREARSGDRPDAGLAKRLHEETDGNPFYIGEVLRHLIEGDASSNGPLEVPESVQEVVVQRLDRLPEMARRALVVAAVVGRDFDIGVVERAGDIGGDDALDALEQATTARFVVEVAGAAGRYRFAHALLREAVYQSASATRRSRLHRKVADALEDLAGADPTPVAAELVAHHLAAGPAGDRAKALDLALRAGDLALAQLAYEDAAAHYEHALDLVPAEHEAIRRATILMALGDALRAAEAEEDAQRAYLEASALARHQGDAETLARAALGAFGRGTHGVSTWVDDDPRVTLLEEAFSALGDAASELRVRVMSALAVAYLLSTEDRHRRDHLAAEAVASARRLGQPEVLAGALAAGRIALWSPLHAGARLAHTNEVVSAAASTGDLEQELRARLVRVTDHFELGDRPGAVAELEAARVLTSQLGQPYWSWRVAAWDALGAMVDGRFVDAETGAEAAVVARGDDSDAHAIQCYGIQLTCLRLVQGRSAEVVPMLASAVERYPMLSTYRAALALCHAEAGHEAEARIAFDWFAVRDFASPPPDSNWSIGVACLAEACARLGDRRSAEPLHEMLSPMHDKMAVIDAFGGGGAYWGSFARLIGLLETTMGRHRNARHSLEAALHAETDFGAVPWVGRTRRALSALAEPQPIHGA